MDLTKESMTDQEEKYFICSSYTIGQNQMKGVLKFGMWNFRERFLKKKYEKNSQNDFKQHEFKLR